MSDDQTPKASYHQPTFSIYGNLAALTKSGNAGTPADNTGQDVSMSIRVR